MADEKAFLLPVVIDETRDAEAKVPTEFKAVQWTRLPGGEQPEKFCARVKALLESGTGVSPVASVTHADQGRDAIATAQVGRRVPAAAWAMAGLAAVALAVGGYFWARRPAESATLSTANAGAGTRPSTLPSAPADDSKSVAVLAFANLSDDKSNEYFSDGISEELLNVLAKVPGLKVSARTSAFFFKGKEVPVPEIAKQLGVAYVVEGSVRKQGDKVRITAQLIKAADGFHVWSDTFTRDLKDIFAVQDEIAGLIAKQLQLKLGDGGVRSAVDPALYEQLLQARALTLRESNEDWRRATALYRRTLEREPRLALAWAEMARTYVQLGRFGGMPIQDAMREARAAAQRALELEPGQATGLVAMGWVQRTADWDWRGARSSFERARELAPGNASIMGDLAVFYFNTGRVAEAKVLARQAVEHDPLNARAQASLGFILNLNGDWEQALVPLRQAVALAPSIEEVRSHQARAFVALGRMPEAAAAAEQEPNEAYRLIARAFIPGPTADAALAEFVAKFGEEMPGYVANIHGIRGEIDPAFAWFERALARRDAAVVWVKTNINNRSLRTDPRWPDFLRKVGLADDQLK
jgi:TolB-like protein/tetratricopeptide (TPR) repeat protein